MSVLLEAFSVLVRFTSVVGKYEGGCEQFIRDVPNSTVCGDGEILRVGFMILTDLTGYIDLLKRRGLTHLDSNGQAVDVVVVDARSGPREPCNWLQFGSADLQKTGSEGLEKASIIWARLKGGQSERIMFPRGWQGPGKVQFVDAATGDRRLRFMRSEGNVDVFEDLETGKEVYVGRTGV